MNVTGNIRQALFDGFRHQGGRSTLTQYFRDDLVAAAVTKHGQHGFDTDTPAGRPCRLWDIARTSSTNTS